VSSVIALGCGSSELVEDLGVVADDGLVAVPVDFGALAVTGIFGGVVGVDGVGGVEGAGVAAVAGGGVAGVIGILGVVILGGIVVEGGGTRATVTIT
jgi:hypothetical protein